MFPFAFLLLRKPFQLLVENDALWQEEEAMAVFPKVENRVSSASLVADREKPLRHHPDSSGSLLCLVVEAGVNY